MVGLKKACRHAVPYGNCQAQWKGVARVLLAALVRHWEVIWVVEGLGCEARRAALKPSGRLAKVCHLLPKKRVGAQCLVVFPHSD